jgi:hypothetical protein
VTRIVCSFLIAISIGSCAPAEAQSQRGPSNTVPFVGCRSDGQQGPLEAPNGKAQALPIAPKVAAQLAYYRAEQGLGVLAPVGWFCFGVLGSNGFALYVSPQEIVSADLDSTSWKGFSGPAIELVEEFGGTSGRFGVARIIARVFPSHKAFVENVIGEGIDPETSFPFGPYPNDKLTYRTPESVEYQTPANADGLGTSWRLAKNADPINGVAILRGKEPDLLHLSVRLPVKLSDLARVIVHQIERDSR